MATTKKSPVRKKAARPVSGSRGRDSRKPAVTSSRSDRRTSHQAGVAGKHPRVKARPGTARPGTTRPGTTRFGTTRPGTTRPGTTRPGTGRAAKTNSRPPAKPAPARTTAVKARPITPAPTKRMVIAPRTTKPRAAGPSGTKPAGAPGTANPKILRATLLDIIRKTSAELPGDVIRGITAGRKKESEGSNALWAMCVIEENIELAREKSLPLCQDTGTIIFHVKAPRGFDVEMFRREAEAAVALATEKGFLRQNSVDSLTGRNSGTNLGPGSPVFHFEQWEMPGLDIRLILKGGGCENVGVQYSLPDNRLGAGRDLKGVEKVILDAVYQAQGKGCGPGILGVCIGGDRGTGYAHSKEQFLRRLDDTNPIPDLAELESRVVKKANALGIGPMGFGGQTTLLGCKVGVRNRLPASFFVSISYMCWAYRRQGAELAPDGSHLRWLY